MKPEPDRLTQWAADAVTFDCVDGPGVTRVYTRDGFKALQAALSKHALQRIEETRLQAKEAKENQSRGLNCKRPDLIDLEKLRRMNPDLGDVVLTDPMKAVAESLSRYGLLLTDDTDPSKDVPAADIVSRFLDLQALLAFEGIRELREEIDRFYIQLMSQAIQSLKDSGSEIEIRTAGDFQAEDGTVHLTATVCPRIPAEHITLTIPIQPET